jgi:hypothetical protein
MLIINEDLWEEDRIVKIQCSAGWGDKDDSLMTKCTLKRLKDLMVESKETSRRGILIYDCNKGEFPPMSQAFQIVSHMVSIKPELDSGLSHSIIYVKSEYHRQWIDNILKIYKPARPINIVSTKEEIKKFLKIE